jgi:hypothetical protein
LSIVLKDITQAWTQTINATAAGADLSQCRGLWVFDRLWVVPVFDYCG